MYEAREWGPSTTQTSPGHMPKLFSHRPLMTLCWIVHDTPLLLTGGFPSGKAHDVRNTHN